MGGAGFLLPPPSAVLLGSAPESMTHKLRASTCVGRGDHRRRCNTCMGEGIPNVSIPRQLQSHWSWRRMVMGTLSVLQGAGVKCGLVPSCLPRK